MNARVLFVCWGNTCRSVIAEHLGRQDDEWLFESVSAGLCPQDADGAEYARRALERLAIDVSGHIPKDVRYLELTNFDFVVTMDSEVFNAFQQKFPGFPIEQIEQWNVSDPYMMDSAYEPCIRVIRGLLEKLAERIQVYMQL